MKIQLNTLLVLQGIYYSLTALWPLVHIESFLYVTGYKYDIWLVKTVGILLLCSGIAFCISGMEKRISIPVLFLSISEALGMAYVDIYYSANDIISKIYLADAVAEAVIIIFIICAIVKSQVAHSETAINK